MVQSLTDNWYLNEAPHTDPQYIYVNVFWSGYVM